MDVDPPAYDSLLKDKADALNALVSGPLAAAAVKASSRSRGIPAGKDFHFFNNFYEFKAPVKEIKEKAESSLRSIAALDGLWGDKKPPEWPEDLEDAYDWLVDLNDELLDRLAVSIEEFKVSRGKEEEEASGKTTSMELDGFQMVCGKKKKKWGDADKNEGISGLSTSNAVNVATRDKRTTAARSKVPFHIPTIRRPQDEYNILVNNQNQPFEHVWLEMSKDGSRFIHPLEKLHILNFIDRNCDKVEPVQPLPLEATPFKLVSSVNDLKMVAAKLRGADEFAVDLEHNQYRSFQGLTCLMQISTRTEDFVIDTLKLRIYIGPHLREVFKDPTKRKILHGADRDILWLQRDFGIYVCNLFDTGQASRVLQLERNSLEYLLNHFCGVNANKEYQNADWRLRPLPDEMLKYAREDTHYLFYVYDQMKRMLINASSDGNDLLLEVYKRSSQVCMQLYEKELLTETSFLNIYGLPYADLNAKQLAVVAGLYQWRDNIARAEDESTGYILPNKTLIEIAKQMPTTTGKLRRLVKLKHPFLECHLNSVIGIIKNAIASSSAFEVVAQKLKESQVEADTEENDCNSPATEDLDSASAKNIDDARSLATFTSVETVKTVAHVPAATDYCLKKSYTENSSCKNSATRVEENKSMPPEIGCSSEHSDVTERIEEEKSENANTKYLQPREDGIASVQLMKKPTSAFGALFGNASSRRKVIPDKEDINVHKVEQIKSMISLPFYQFSGVKPAEPQVKETNSSATETVDQQSADLAKLEEVIPLDTEGECEQPPSDSPMTDDETNVKETSDHPEVSGGGDLPPNSNNIDEPLSPSGLTSSFENCLKSLNELKNSQKKQNISEEPETNFNLRPFDYSAARQSIKFDEVREKDEAKTEDETKTSPDNRQARKDAACGKLSGEERSRGPLQPRRRQAFPPSGNRSTTYH